MIIIDCCPLLSVTVVYYRLTSITVWYCHSALPHGLFLHALCTPSTNITYLVLEGFHLLVLCITLELKSITLNYYATGNTTTSFIACLFIVAAKQTSVTSIILLPSGCATLYYMINPILFLLQAGTYCIMGWSQGSTLQTAGPILIAFDVARTIMPPKFQAIIFIF